MIAIIRTVLWIINMISFVMSLVFGMFGLYDEIMGAANAEKLLKKMNVPLTYDQVIVVFFVTVVIMITTYIAREKLSGK